MTEVNWPSGHVPATIASVKTGIPYRRVLRWCREHRVRKEPAAWAISNAQMRELKRDG
jgi:hypothetical protein